MADKLEEVRVLGIQLMGAYGVVADKYWRLCCLIREDGLEPRKVRRVLLSVGMSKVRVSEILMVAGSPKKIFNEYRERFLGFKLALEKARKSKHPAQVVGKLLMRQWEKSFYRVTDRRVDFEDRAIVSRGAVAIAFRPDFESGSEFKKTIKSGDYQIEVTVKKKVKS